MRTGKRQDAGKHGNWLPLMTTPLVESLWDGPRARIKADLLQGYYFPKTSGLFSSSVFSGKVFKFYSCIKWCRRKCQEKWPPFGTEYKWSPHELVTGVIFCFLFQSVMGNGVIVAVPGMVQDGYFLKSLRFPLEVQSFVKWPFLWYKFTHSH